MSTCEVRGRDRAEVARSVANALRHGAGRRPSWTPAIALIASVMLTGCRDLFHRFDANMRYHDYGDESEWIPPENLAEMVEYADVIVIARHDSVVDLGTFLVFTPEPAELITPEAMRPPVPEFDLVATTVTIDSVLKGGELVGAGDSITYTSVGTVPRGATEVEQDKISGFPHMWSPGTEFIFFLNRHSDDGASSSFAEYYYIGESDCGRVLTGGNTVTCSDGERTRLKFMDGVDRDEFIAAIQTEVANPSDTATPYPFPSLTPTPMDTADPP